MELDVSGLTPLDTTGLRPAGSDLDVSGLTPLDASGLSPMGEPAGDDEAWKNTSLVDKALNPLKAGALSLKRGVEGLGADLSGRSLSVMDRIDRGESVPDMQDPVGYQHMSPEQRAAARRQAETDIGQSAGMAVETGRRIADIPQNPAAQRMMGAKTWGDAGRAFWSDPLGVIASVGLQSLPAMAPALVAGAVGGPVAGGVAMGASSAGTEYLSSVLEGLANEGVDTNNEAALVQAFRNPDTMARVRDRAATRAGIIGSVDGATMGLAGKTLVPQMVKGHLAREALNVPAQIAAQGAMGGGAEAGAQIATEGRITEPGQVLGEIVGEAFGAPAEVLALRHAARPPAGIAPHNVTPADIASPIPTDLISAGRSIVDELLAPKPAVAESVADLPQGAVPAEVLLGSVAEPEATEAPVAPTAPVEPVPVQPAADTETPAGLQPLYDDETDQQIGWFDPETGRARPMEDSPPEAQAQEPAPPELPPSPPQTAEPIDLRQNDGAALDAPGPQEVLPPAAAPALDFSAQAEPVLPDDAAPAAPEQMGGALRWKLRNSEVFNAQIMGNDDHPVGVISGRFQPRGIQVRTTEMEDVAKGKGFGVRAYAELADIAHQQGGALLSDGEVTEEAVRVYEALGRRGYAVTRNPNALWIEDRGERKLVTKHRSIPVFQVEPRSAPSTQPARNIDTSPILTRAGTPFATEKGAALAARQRPDLKGQTLEPVRVDGGWGLQTVDQSAASPPNVAQAETQAQQAPQGEADQLTAPTPEIVQPASLPDLGPPLPARQTRINDAARTPGVLEASIRRADETRNRARQTPDQRRASEVAQAETLGKFDEAAASGVADWKARSNAERNAQSTTVRPKEWERGYHSAQEMEYRAGWNDALAGRPSIDPEFPAAYRKGVLEARVWVEQNPRPEGRETIDITARTSRGQETRYSLPADADAIRTVRGNVEKLPVDRFSVERDAGFVQAPDGSPNFGEIGADAAAAIGRQPGAIRLREGDAASGLAHIRERHAEDARQRGYDSVEAMVADVARNYSEIHKGAGRTLILVKRDGRQSGATWIQLEPSPNGDFYDVKTATPTRMDFMGKQEPAWKRSARRDATDSNGGVATSPAPFSARAQVGEQNVGDSAPEANQPKGEADSLRLAPAFEQALPSIEADLRARLQRYGIADRVGLRLVDAIRNRVTGEPIPNAAGRYGRRVIEVALDASSRTFTVDHETIHALRDLDLIRPLEWRALQREVLADNERMADVRARYPQFGRTDTRPELTDRIIEEAVADLFGRWQAGQVEAKGFVRTAMERIRDFLRAVGQALRGEGFRTVDSVFRAIDRGEIGRRGVDEADAGVLAEAHHAQLQPRGEDGRFVPGAPEDRYSVEDPTAAPAPQAAEARRSLMTRLAGAQPIDRVARLPFDLFGGLNGRNEWKAGLYLNQQAARAISSAEFRSDGRLGWMNGILHKARAGLIDRYGLDAAYVERDRQRGLDERRIMAKVPELMKMLADQDVKPEEMQTLQAILTGEEVADARWEGIATPIRQAIDQLGAEAVELGLLSPEAFERNRGKYLHRVYAKHEADQGSLAAWVDRKMTGRRQKIVGDQFKGRGLFLEVAPAKLFEGTDGSWDGRIDVERAGPPKGTKVVMLEKMAEVDADKPDAKRKVLKRTYALADRFNAEDFTGYENRGEWEVRGQKNGKVVIWRDFEKAERQQMGEIVDARYTLAKTYMSMAHDLSTGRFFRDVAGNAEWSREGKDEPPSATWKEAGDYNRFWTDPAIQWVKVPDTKIPKSDTKRYGALSGRFVRAEIWRDMAELEAMQKPGWWDHLMRQWKANKTYRSPVVHMNNIMSNVMFMDMADVRAADLARGVRSLLKRDDLYREALDQGAFGSNMLAQEIREEVLNPILEEIDSQNRAGKGGSGNYLQDAFIGASAGGIVAGPVGAAIGGAVGIANSFGLLGKLADRLFSGVKAADRKMMNAYQMEDEVFRMALYLRRRDQGASPEQAALEAKDTFLDYDIRAPWVNAAKRYALPFISYTYRAAPMIARTLMARPWKMAKYFTMMYAFNALAYAIDGGDEDEERRSLRENEQGWAWTGWPRMMRLPTHDQHGNPVFLDIRRWIPGGDLFDTGQGQSVIPMLGWMQPGGPLMIAAELLLNRAAFTGKDISNKLTDTVGERIEKGIGHAYKSWIPSAAWIPGSWYWDRIGNAVTGARDWSGRPYSVPQAIASSVGIKVKPQDVQEGFAAWGREFDKAERELETEARRASNDRDRGLLSEVGFQRTMERLTKKFEQLGERRRATFEGVSK